MDVAISKFTPVVNGRTGSKINQRKYLKFKRNKDHTKDHDLNKPQEKSKAYNRHQDKTLDCTVVFDTTADGLITLHGSQNENHDVRHEQHIKLWWHKAGFTSTTSIFAATGSKVCGRNTKENKIFSTYFKAQKPGQDKTW